MPDSAVDQVKAILAQRQAELADELAQVSAALAALNGIGTDVTVPSSATPTQRPSVRTMLLNLLNEEDRDWSAPEVLAEYQRRGNPVHGVDPNNALRAAIADAHKAGQIVRTATGRYRSAKWAKEHGVTIGPVFYGGGIAHEEVATG